MVALGMFYYVIMSFGPTMKAMCIFVGYYVSRRVE